MRIAWHLANQTFQDQNYTGLYLRIRFTAHQPFEAQRFLSVPPGLTFENSIWRSLCFEYFVWISEQTVTFALYIIN